MKWLILLLIFAGSNIFACEGKINFDDKSVSVCVEGTTIFSKMCKNVEDCFKLPEDVEFGPSQNPLFSVCYGVGGVAYFAKLDGKRDSVTVCVNSDDKAVDLDSLMSAYKNKKSK